MMKRERRKTGKQKTNWNEYQSEGNDAQQSLEKL